VAHFDVKVGGAIGHDRNMRPNPKGHYPPPYLNRPTTGESPEAEKRYSPAVCIGAHKTVIEGEPDPKHISTSFSERSNLNVRMHTRRFTRLMNAFSKKVENHAHSVALFAMYYNFVRIHKTLQTTPAMAAKVTERLWEIGDIVNVLEAWEAAK
jgi:hypothetical protein